MNTKFNMTDVKKTHLFATNDAGNSFH